MSYNRNKRATNWTDDSDNILALGKYPSFSSNLFYLVENMLSCVSLATRLSYLDFGEFSAIHQPQKLLKADRCVRVRK